MEKNKKSFLIEFFSLAVPIMLQSLSGNILNLCDTLMVSQLSETAISGITVANKTFFIFHLVIFGASSGVSIFMAQYYGAKDEKSCRQAFGFGVRMCLGVAILFLLFLFLAPERAFTLYVKNPETIAAGLSYIRIVRFSYVPVAVNVMMAVYFRITQRQNIPMYSGIISVAVNILFNYILIFGKLGAPRLEIRGAAYGTLLSRIFEMSILVVLFCRGQKKEGEKRKREFLSRQIRGNMLKKILPLIVNETVWAAALNMIFKNYCRVNETYIPAITVVDNIFDMVNVAFIGCSMTAGIVMGKYLGADKLSEAKKVSVRLIKIDLLVSVAVSLCVFAVAPYIPLLFALKGELLLVTTLLLRIKVLFSWTQGYGETIYYILRAGGDTRAVFLVDGLFMLMGPFLVSTLASRLTEWPLPYVYFCTEGIYLMKLFVTTYLYKKGKWAKNIVAKVE